MTAEIYKSDKYLVTKEKLDGVEFCLISCYIRKDIAVMCRFISPQVFKDKVSLLSKTIENFDTLIAVLINDLTNEAFKQTTG